MSYLWIDRQFHAWLGKARTTTPSSNTARLRGGAGDDVTSVCPPLAAADRWAHHSSEPSFHIYLNSSVLYNTLSLTARCRAQIGAVGQG